MMIDHEQIKHDLNIEARILDYMDELDNMTQDVDPNTVRLRLRSILGRAEDALFQRSIYGYPQD
jgi:hypothetical protein